jgi:very-short-patch-repair endonuclease
MHFHPCPKPPPRPKKPRKPIQRSRKPINRKSKFHAQTDVTKRYRNRRSASEVAGFAEKCRQIRLANPTPAEQAFAELLQELGVEFEREKIIIYANGQRFLIADFYCEGRNTIFEIDGGCHKQQARYDDARDRWLLSQGIRTIRFTNTQVLRDHEGCKEKIIETISNL